MSLSSKCSFLRNSSLINKMLLLNFIGIASAMIMVLVLLSLVYSSFSRQSLANNILAQARLLAANTAPMLAFHDLKEAKKLAATFKELKDLRQIIIFDAQDFPVVQLQVTEGDDIPSAVRARLPGTLSESANFIGNSLFVFVPIYLETERMGTVLIESGLSSIKNNIVVFISIATIATSIAIFLSAFILRKLQMWALSPIIDMSRLAEEVATSRKYHLRAEVNGSDEIASLAVRFNQMLEKIEIWEKDLNDEIDQRRKSERHLDRLARTDGLTKLPNRLAFNDDLASSVAHAVRTHQEIALMFVDLDDFKQVNDTYGHQNGDQVLIIISRRITGILRETDRLYRLGGDEFAVIVKAVAKKEQAVLIGHRLIAAASERINIVDKSNVIEVQVGASVGLAFCPTHGNTANRILRRADLAMYAAKQDGKNKFRLFMDNMEEQGRA